MVALEVKNGNNILNVVSFFDGMSCGQIALERAGFKVDKYFAAEIDKYAIKVTQANYPNTIQIGDVCGVQYEDGALFHHQNDNPLKNGGSYIADIDLLIGGSPCQGFSFAGKQLNFDDPRSKLFFEFVRFLKECNPKYFLLENVRMKRGYQDIISNYLGCEPLSINSSLLSAQNRKRLYWTNIPSIKLPIDRGIVLKDIMIEKTNEYAKISKKGKYKKYQDKSSCITGGGHSGGNHSDMDLFGIPKDRCYQIGEAIGINGHDLLKRVYADYGKSPAVTTITGGNQYGKIAVDDYQWRRLTPIEVERLQTVPDNYTDHVSNSARYKMLGNGWTVDVICHILKNMSI